MKVNRHTIVWTGAVAVVTAGFLGGVTWPQLRRGKALTDQIAILSGQQPGSSHYMEAIAKAERELERIGKETADFNQRVPQDKSLGAFLEELARCADACRLQPDEIQPGEPVQTAEVFSLPIEFSVRGPFPAVYKLMQSIEQMPRLTCVDRFEVLTDGDDPAHVSAQVSLRIFYLVSSGEAQAT